MPQIIKPQEGPQEAFLSTSADIAIYGGAAGGGKSYALLMEPLRHIDNGEFGAVIFRRNSKQMKRFYPALGKTEDAVLFHREFRITKADDEKQYIFGWANVANNEDGSEIEDWQKDIVPPDELEESAYQYVLNFRDMGEKHDKNLRKKGKLIESVVFTKEKQKAIGIPEGYVPEGWWIGFYIDDPKTWKKVKDGDYQMFSVEGTGVREKVKQNKKPVRKSKGRNLFQKSFEKYYPKNKKS